MGVGDYFRVLVICREREGFSDALSEWQSKLFIRRRGKRNEGIVTWHIITVLASGMPNVCISTFLYKVLANMGDYNLL